MLSLRLQVPGRSDLPHAVPFHLHNLLRRLQIRNYPFNCGLRCVLRSHARFFDLDVSAILQPQELPVLPLLLLCHSAGNATFESALDRV